MSKTMNFRSALLLMVIALVGMPLFAQPGRGPGQGQRPQMSEQDLRDRLARTADTLNLTEKQKKEILEFELEFYKTMQKERENFNPETGDREAMRATMMKLRDERDAKYKKVLTAEQFEKYTRIEEGRRSQMRQRQGQGQGTEGEQGRGRGRGGN